MAKEAAIFAFLVVSAIPVNGLSNDELLLLGSKCNDKLNELSFDVAWLKDLSKTNADLALKRGITDSECFMQADLNDLIELNGKLNNLVRQVENYSKFGLKGVQESEINAMHKQYLDIERKIDADLAKLRSDSAKCIKVFRSRCKN